MFCLIEFLFSFSLSCLLSFFIIYSVSCIFINPLLRRLASCPRALSVCGLALMMSWPSWECVLNVGLGMKAVILNMAADKSWWLQCCLKSETRRETKWTFLVLYPSKVFNTTVFLLYVYVAVVIWCAQMQTHSRLCLITQFHNNSSIRLGDFILLKGPLWHFGECVGHLTHATHVSEYIYNTAISFSANKTPCSTRC